MVAFFLDGGQRRCFVTVSDVYVQTWLREEQTDNFHFAAKNLCNHATVAQGDKDKLVVEPSLKRAVAAFAAQDKPIGLCCIVHEETGADGVCVDASRKVVTSCAYMFAGAPHEIYESVGRMVEETLGLC